MTENSSAVAMQEPHDENMPDQRFTRRKLAYSLLALMTALVVAVFYMSGNSSSGAMQEPNDENMPDQRLNRRQVAYSLTALIAALVVAAFGIAFAYQSIDDSDSPHVHAADSKPHSHVDVGDGVAEDLRMGNISQDENHDEPALNEDAGHEPHDDAPDDHRHGGDE